MNPFISPTERFAQAKALRVLERSGLPFLVGGAWAMFHLTGVCRYTKDLDVFLRREDESQARRVLAKAGFRTHVQEPMWLSKAWWGDVLIDIIYSSGNGVAEVDAQWLAFGESAEILGVRTRIVPPEEMIWSKGFVQERERYDGADVAHIVRARGHSLDWNRLLARFENHWEVLFAHLTLYLFSYPHDRAAVPEWVWATLMDRAGGLRSVGDADDGKVCRGTLLSRTQYMPDVGLWGYRDARVLEVDGFEPDEGELCEARFARMPAASEAGP